jgi:hypothetical protein
MAGLGLLAGCGAVPWQQPTPPRTYRVGYLGPLRTPEGLAQALSELGYVQERNLII